MDTAELEKGLENTVNASTVFQALIKNQSTKKEFELRSVTFHLFCFSTTTNIVLNMQLGKGIIHKLTCCTQLHINLITYSPILGPSLVIQIIINTSKSVCSEGRHRL